MAIDFAGAGTLLSQLQVLVRTRLWAQIVAALILGVSLGVALAPSGGALVSERVADQLGPWLALPGHLFLALIQMVVVPLVISSISVGICSAGDPTFLRKVGVRIAPYFVGTTTVAVLLGAVVALTVQPGAYVDASLLVASGAEVPAAAAAPDAEPLPHQVVMLIPANPLRAMLDNNMLQVVVAALIFAVAMVSLPLEHQRPLVALLEAVQQLSMKIVSWAMLLAPWAVFGLIAEVTMRVGLDVLAGMAVYVGTVIGGLLLLLLFYLLVVATLGRHNPIKFAGAIRDAQLLAFSTSSSAAVMPLSMETAETRLGVKPAISKFVIPLGATVNMDGTALYQVVAAVFLMQVYGIEISPGSLMLIAGTTVGASIGSPSTPGVGIVILATILADVGVPPEGVALIIGVDRILDMARTAVNVSGDLTACVVMNRWLADVAEDVETTPAET